MHTPGCGCVYCDTWNHFDPEDCPFCLGKREVPIFEYNEDKPEEVKEVGKKPCDCVKELEERSKRKS